MRISYIHTKSRAMKLKCLAIDDKQYLLKVIESYIKKTPFLELVALCENPLEAFDIIASEQVDLIFLDISMPEMSGMDFAKSLSRPIPIIFTTSHTEYAAESYRLNAVDYLVKPFQYDVFLKAANKALDLVSRQQPVVEPDDADFIYVKSEGKLVKVVFSEVAYIESLSEYIKVHFCNQTSVMSLMSLKKIEQHLPADSFMRVHRSFIINLNRIELVERARVMINSEYISVSEQYRKRLKEEIDRFTV